MWFCNYLSANNNLLYGFFIDQVGHSPGGLLLGLDISLDEDVDRIDQRLETYGIDNNLDLLMIADSEGCWRWPGALLDNVQFIIL